eukprot:15478261-Alexandrium_andersonii.AAC.1
MVSPGGIPGAPARTVLVRGRLYCHGWPRPGPHHGGEKGLPIGAQPCSHGGAGERPAASACWAAGCSSRPVP